MSDTNSSVSSCVNDLWFTVEVLFHTYAPVSVPRWGRRRKKPEVLSNGWVRVCLWGLTSAVERRGFPVTK